MEKLNCWNDKTTLLEALDYLTQKREKPTWWPKEDEKSYWHDITVEEVQEAISTFDSPKVQQYRNSIWSYTVEALATSYPKMTLLEALGYRTLKRGRPIWWLSHEGSDLVIAPADMLKEAIDHYEDEKNKSIRDDILTENILSGEIKGRKWHIFTLVVDDQKGEWDSTLLAETIERAIEKQKLPCLAFGDQVFEGDLLKTLKNLFSPQTVQLFQYLADRAAWWNNRS